MSEDRFARVLSLEAEGPTASAYAAALRAVSAALHDDETRAAHQDAIARWLLPALGLSPTAATVIDAWRQALWDAVVDMVADARALAEFFDATAGRFEAHPGARPNLLSLLRTKAVWRARDKLRRERTQARYVDSGATAPEASGDDRDRFLARLVAERVVQRYAGEPAVGVVLGELLMGGSVSDASRQSGLSRQAIYRWLDRVRGWLEEAP